jgi:hypothetical protein
LPDCGGETSINNRALNAIAKAAKSCSPVQQTRTVFVTFAGGVSASTQSWLAAKNHFAIKLSDLHRSADVEKQIAQAKTADFVEVADPDSKWLSHWLPSGPIQGSILSTLRGDSSFEELDPIVGAEGVLYLFRKK